MATDNIFTSDGQAQADSGPRRENLFADGFLATNAYAELAELAGEAVAQDTATSTEIDHAAPIDMATFATEMAEATGATSSEGEGGSGAEGVTREQGDTEIGHDSRAQSVEAMTTDASVEAAQSAAVEAPDTGIESYEPPRVQDKQGNAETTAAEHDADVEQEAETASAEHSETSSADPTLLEFDYVESDGSAEQDLLYMADIYAPMSDTDFAPMSESDSITDAATGIEIGQDFDWNDIV